MFFSNKINTILTNILCWGEGEVVTKHGEQWQLKEIRKEGEFCEFSFPTEKNLFEFLNFCQKNEVGKQYGIVLTVVEENGKLWYVDFTFYNDSDLENEGEFDELVRVFQDMKEYYKS